MKVDENQTSLGVAELSPVPPERVKLSPEMRRAVNWAHRHGGTIKRFPGGYWGAVDVRGFGTTTIQALVSRGVFQYSDWQDRRGGGRFPIEVALNEPERETETTTEPKNSKAS